VQGNAAMEPRLLDWYPKTGGFRGLRVGLCTRGQERSREQVYIPLRD
jgi:hypothetical protein